MTDDRGDAPKPAAPPAAKPAAPAAAPTSPAAQPIPGTTSGPPIPQSIDETRDRPANAADARTVKDEDGNDIRVVGDPNQPLTQVSDPEGKISNRVEGTLQREPRAEDLPPDAKIAPVAEQVAPNQAALAVGARPTPESIAGVEQPEEGEKNPVPDASDPAQFLSPESDQHDEAERAAEDSHRAVDRAIDRQRRGR